MKMLVLALALVHPIETGSFGIGIDVFSEAFSYAARRVGLVPDLRLASCRDARCLWDLGEGVKLAADQSGPNLSIYRIEAMLDASRRDSLSSRRRYEQACLAIVALVDRDGQPAEQRVTAAAISGGSAEAKSGIARDLPERTISFYGKSAGTDPARCGAVAS